VRRAAHRPDHARAQGHDGRTQRRLSRHSGGIGTLEELFEVWTWRQLGYHDKPIGVLDADGYYRQMLGFLEHSVQSGFMGDWQMELVRVGRSVPELLAALVQEAGLPKGTKPLRSVI